SSDASASLASAVRSALNPFSSEQKNFVRGSRKHNRRQRRLLESSPSRGQRTHSPGAGLRNPGVVSPYHFSSRARLPSFSPVRTSRDRPNLQSEFRSERPHSFSGYRLRGWGHNSAEVPH